MSEGPPMEDVATRTRTFLVCWFLVLSVMMAGIVTYGCATDRMTSDEVVELSYIFGPILVGWLSSLASYWGFVVPGKLSSMSAADSRSMAFFTKAMAALLLLGLGIVLMMRLFNLLDFDATKTLVAAIVGAVAAFLSTAFTALFSREQREG